jgi:histidinol phosphatase-like enzyme (inositol monophosphatase family)
MDLDGLMEFAVGTTEEAGKITRAHFGRTAVEYKHDGSELTEADRAAEAFMRSAISERFPGDGIFGEEEAEFAGDSDFRWIIDPIDGTRAFASGVPIFGVLLALEFRGTPLLGCIHLPLFDETLVAATGAGCWWNGRPARVSACDRLADARIVTSGLEYWRDWATPVGRSGFDRLVGAGRFARTWGDCFGYALIATGRAEVMVDPACGAYWDYAPMLPIVAEAGGLFTTLSRQPIRAWTSALATNRILHESAAAHWDPVLGDAAVQIPEIHQRHQG